MAVHDISGHSSCQPWMRWRQFYLEVCRQAIAWEPHINFSPTQHLMLQLMLNSRLQCVSEAVASGGMWV